MNKAKLIDIDLMNKIMPDGDLTFVDIGAFTGNCTIVMSKAFPAATIHAIEACPVNFGTLKKKTADYDKINIYNIALSDCDCKRIDFYITNDEKTQKKHGKSTSQSNSLYEEFLSSRGKKTSAVSVRSMSVRTFCKKNGISQIDFLKVNCEGCEYKIFDNDENDFLDSVRMICIEFHTKVKIFKSKEFVEKRKEINKLFKQKGFKLIDGSKDLEKGKHIVQVWSK
jgi:FkbM family methyltransferase